jgi:glycosyltransferase involved in cell wall biosynthesis
MKILHVTDELSKKNYSISSLIFYLSNYFKETQGYSYNVLASEIQTDVFNKEKEIQIINFQKFSDIFNKNESLKEAIISAKVVHVHGLWRAINLLVVFYCIQLNKNFFIHPHGMLLDPSLKNKGTINYYFKIILLNFFNFIYGNNLNFISITNQEIKSILNFFPNSKNIFIPNPVLEYNQSSKIEVLNKRFVFFGRIHSIKNIDLMITAFINANLNNEWELVIYGIPDDLIYEKKLKENIKNIKNVRIEEPVFGNKKNEILRSSWANLLLSKSEVLSLSVLESASLGLPSLVNKNIQIDKFDEHEGEVTSLELKEISKKISDISLWSTETRVQKGKKLQKFISDNFNIEKIKEKYLPIYSDLESNQKKRDNNNFFNIVLKIFFDSIFLNTSISYLFNFMIPTLISLLVTFAYSKPLAADLAITSSLLITLTQVFSSNMKSQIIAKNNLELSNSTILFRIVFSFILLILFTTLYFNQTYFKYENFFTVSLIVFVILIQWVCEIILCNKELKKENYVFIYYNIINIIFSFLFIVVIIFVNKNLNSILILYIIFIFLFTIFQLKSENLEFHIKNLKLGFMLNIKSLAFLSSTSLIVSSIIWRLIIFNLFPKSISAIIFACFSIGSFPGTAFNLAIGPTYVKRNISINNSMKKFIYFFYFLIFTLCILSTYMLFINKSLSLPNNYFIFYTLSFSLLGSFFMTYAMYVRQRSIQLTHTSRTSVFMFDIIYGLSISLYCPLLFYIGDVYGTSLSFFLASITAYLTYSIILGKK